MSDKKPQKIAVLGGGVSSMTSVYELTNDPNWKEKYDITVYQIGWRLGGKGASGRNQKVADRIEEHGLHLWFGFYNNAFNFIKQCYEDNNRPLGMPLSCWEEAFKPYNFVVLMDKSSGEWLDFEFRFPDNNIEPGGSEEPPTPKEYIPMMLAFLDGFYKQYRETYELEPTEETKEHETFWEELKDWWGDIKEDVHTIKIDIGARLIYSAMKIVDKLDEKYHSKLIDVLDKILEYLWSWIQEKIKDDPEALKLWIIFDLFMAMIKGIVRDHVITKGFEAINHLDFREWIKQNGASEMTLDSGVVQGVYGLVFGGYKYYTFEAGTALNGCLRLLFTYHGSIYWRMQAGMGDVIFAPIYEVLKKRGVKFEFFHKVTNLKLSEDKKFIEEINIDRQVNLKDSNKEYQPLFNVKNLPSWPSEPLYDQIDPTEAAALKKDDINLESYYTTWKNVGKVNLRRGKDYDIVIQGLSIGAIPYVCKEIMSLPERQDWRDMCQFVTATGTIAFQLWMKPDVAGLGWPYWTQDMPLLGSYEEPYDTWADMSDLIIRENWPEQHFPNNIAYLCGPIMGIPFPPFTDHAFPNRMYDFSKKEAYTWVTKYGQRVWPNCYTKNPDEFRWDLLVDINDGDCEERFDAQFFRANIDPTELYVLSETNSSKYRIKTDETGYANLYFTGDWIDNGFNAGCVEASVMAGMQTARSISGRDIHIHGEPERMRKHKPS